MHPHCAGASDRAMVSFMPSTQLGGSPREVAEQCDITIAVLADPEAALEVAAGPDGVASGISAGVKTR